MLYNVYRKCYQSLPRLSKSLITYVVETNFPLLVFLIVLSEILPNIENKIVSIECFGQFLSWGYMHLSLKDGLQQNMFKYCTKMDRQK